MANPMHARVRLKNPLHRMPMPGAGRWFGSASDDKTEIVDMGLLFWIACMSDGTIELAPEAPPAEVEAAPDDPFGFPA